MALEKMGTAGSGVAILVSAGIVYEIIAAACSSPQTTHINAPARADTLMFWVYCGEVQAAVFVGLAAYFDRRFAKEYIAGGLLAGITMHACYVYAKTAGLADAAMGRQGTESYG